MTQMRKKKECKPESCKTTRHGFDKWDIRDKPARDAVKPAAGVYKETTM